VEIACFVFPGITVLDVVGPYEVLQRLPGAQVRFVGATTGEVRADNGALGLMADVSIDDVTAPDVVVIPGGFGTRALLADAAVLDWVRAVHERTTWTTSVCTGSLVLAAAGLLDGVPATTHWREMDTLARYGAVPTGERVVRHGKILTAAGVSSGIDMALTLAGEIAGPDVARAIQLGIEYDPQPPFDAGSVAKAGPEIVALVDAAMASRRAG
jgi:putative intracellular protease/amidase